MKRKHVLIFAALFCVAAYGQDTFAPVGATWYYSTLGDLSSFAQYTVVQDSVAETDGKIYKIVSGTTNEILYQENGKVYFLFENQLYLIYDFDAQTGDIINVYAKSYDPLDLTHEIVLPVQYRVESITQLVINGNSYRRFTTTLVPNDDYLLDEEYSYPDYYIYNEKMGSEYFFILTILPPHTAIDDNNLRCYSDSEISYVSSYWQSMGDGNSCDYRSTDAINTINNSNIKLLINEQSQQITLISDLQDFNIELLNIQGRTCLNKHFANTDAAVLNIAGLNAGIYFAVVRSNGQRVFTQKIVLFNNL